MPAYVRADFGIKPVKAIRFKKSGEWREVTRGYIKIGNNLRLWWPNFSDLVGSSSTAQVTLAADPPQGLAWIPGANNFVVSSRSSFSGQWFQHFDYEANSEIFQEHWRDRRMKGSVSQLTAWEPEVVAMETSRDGNSIWALDRYGLRLYPINEFGQLTQSWSSVQSTFPTVTFNTDVVHKPPLVIGGDPTPAGRTVSGQFYDFLGGIAESNSGYINAPTGKDSFFGYNDDFDVDPDGNFAYVLDRDNRSIRKVSLTPPYAVTTLAGFAPTGTRGSEYTTLDNPASSVDGVGLDARFEFAAGSRSRLTIHPSGDYLMVFQNASPRMLRKVWLRDVGDHVEGEVETWATRGTLELNEGIQPNRLPPIVDLAFDPSGRWLYLVQGFRVLKVDMESQNGTVTVLSGPTSQGNTGYVDDEDPSLTRFSGLDSISVNPSNGWLMLAEHPSGSDRLRFIF